MTSRVLPFFAGCALSQILILNHTYENELLKKQLRKEIDTLKRMKDFEIDQVAQPRDINPTKSARDEQCNLENMDTFYLYFWACTLNTVREGLFSFHISPSLRKL